MVTIAMGVGAATNELGGRLVDIIDFLKNAVMSV